LLHGEVANNREARAGDNPPSRVLGKRQLSGDGGVARKLCCLVDGFAIRHTPPVLKRISAEEVKAKLFLDRLTIR